MRGDAGFDRVSPQAIQGVNPQADIKADGGAHRFIFICRLGQVEIDGQAFDADAPAVILVDRDNLVFHTYTP